MTRTRRRAATDFYAGLIIALLTCAALLCGGCEEARPARTPEQLLEARNKGRELEQAQIRESLQKLVARAVAEDDAHRAGKRSEPSLIDVLIISGGGDWGAFGAGLRCAGRSISCRPTSPLPRCPAWSAR
jgi:hypothetical protein